MKMTLNQDENPAFWRRGGRCQTSVEKAKTGGYWGPLEETPARSLMSPTPRHRFSARSDEDSPGQDLEGNLGLVPHFFGTGHTSSPFFREDR